MLGLDSVVISMFHRTQLLLDQAHTFERAGQWQAAVELCESVYTSSIRTGIVDDMLEALLRLALLYSSRGDRDVAGEYYDLVLHIGEALSDHRRTARALNGLGILHQRAGDIDVAERCYLEARTRTDTTRDKQTRGDIELNLGIIANIRGELTSAVDCYKSALVNYEQVGNQQRVARVLNNIGMLYTDMQQYAEAESVLDRALCICGLIGDVQVEGIVLANKAELLLATGSLEEARRCCDSAFEIASRLGNSQLRADVLKSYGVIFRETDKPHLAESHFRQAIDAARSFGFPLIEADAWRELALVLRQQNENKEALQALNNAHALFSSLQAKHEQADIDKRFAQLEADFLALVAVWGESIEAKDRYTKGHCTRVASYACRIAAHAGFPEREMTWFRMGAFLHDIGKVEVPEAILNKPGRLTEEERAIIERHTIVGDEMLASTEFPWDVRPMVRSHHERWDGRGYPDGLSGTDIPFAARILHIADVFDALTSTRSYRNPLSPEDAAQLMSDDIGSFDPELFSIFRSNLGAISAPVSQT